MKYISSVLLLFSILSSASAQRVNAADIKKGGTYALMRYNEFREVVVLDSRKSIAVTNCANGDCGWVDTKDHSKGRKDLKVRMEEALQSASDVKGDDGMRWQFEFDDGNEGTIPEGDGDESARLKCIAHKRLGFSKDSKGSFYNARTDATEILAHAQAMDDGTILILPPGHTSKSPFAFLYKWTIVETTPKK